jgi:DNA-binding NtrC family response regulator
MVWTRSSSEREPQLPGVPAAAAGAVPEEEAGPVGMGLRILIVDDEEVQRRIIAEILGAAGYQVETAGDLPEALARVEQGGLELVVTDLKMPGGSGLELLERVKETEPDMEVILMTAFSTVQTAVEAMRKGAYHYLTKPFEKDELLLTAAQAREKIRLRRENRQLRGLMAERYGFAKMLGSSPGMRGVYRTIEKVHSAATTVLIRGESGTGKELVARAIHSSGIRRGRPFVAINCAAIPEMLIESELFGHEKGAFTGALTAKVGRFEEVEDGTIFLDEIGSMQYDLQAKLLRVIQEREFQRVGGSRTLRFRARIVAATSQDLEALLDSNRFREDLYFRLNVVPIELPPLRERPGDLPLLACHFLQKFANELGKAARSISPRALDLLEAYDWPGNVRELENVMERMLVLADDAAEVIEESMVPGTIVESSRRRLAAAGEAVEEPGAEERAFEEIEESPAAGEPAPGAAAEGTTFLLPPRGIRLADLERDLIRQALARSGGKLEPAAQLLGISYKTLQYRVKKFQLKDHQR